MTETTESMSKNRFHFDPCESGCLVLDNFVASNCYACSMMEVEIRTRSDPLLCLRNFLRDLREGRRQNDMDELRLFLTEYTQEIAAGVLDVFQCCFSKGIKWKTLTIDVGPQNHFLHLILSEARKLQQFQEVDILCFEPLTNETAMEIRAMMSSERGLDRLWLMGDYMTLLPGVLTTLSEGLRANRVGALDFLDVEIMEREEVMVDDEGEQDSEGGGEVAFFIEELRKNSSVKEIALDGTHLSDERLSNLIHALDGHPMLQRLSLNGNWNWHEHDGFDQTKRALAKLVENHPELQDLGDISRISPDIEYMLDLNRSGRVLLTKPSTPLSVWPKVLERAGSSIFENKTDSDVRAGRRASVIYGLLQGPAFRARSPNDC
jgi:hypothetical protein